MSVADLDSDIFETETAGTINVETDSFIFVDADNGGDTALEAVKDLVAAVAGTVTTSALTSTNGVMAVSPGGATALTSPAVGDKILLCDVDDTNANKSATLTNVAKAIGEVAAGTNATSALSEVDGVMRVNIAGTTAKDTPVAADAVLINDSENSNVNKSCTFTNLVKAIGSTMAGDGLAATAGVLAVDANELTEAAIAIDADYIPFVDADDNGTKKEAVADVITAAAGNGLSATSGVLAVDANELTEAAVAVDADYFAFVDADDNGTKKEAVADLATAFVGTAANTALSATNGVISVAPTEVAVDMGADSVVIKDATDGFVHTDSIVDLASGFAGDGLSAASGVLAVDLNELTEEVAVVATDYIPFIDATDNSSKKEAITDLVGLMAGDGLTATNGVLALTANTDWQTVIPLASGIANGGTWTPTVTSNVFTVVRTANNATEYWYAPLQLPNRTTASKGVKLTSVDVAYSLAGADTTDDDLEIWIVKNTVGTDGNATTGAILAGDADTDYDGAHDTKAERLDPTGAPELHTATVTIPVGEQAYAADNETYWINFMVKDNAGADLTLILTGAVANWTETLG